MSEIYRYIDKPRKCPCCGSEKIADYQYGLPAFSPRLVEDLKAGKKVLGGCEVGHDDPPWQCFDCKTDFYRDWESSILAYLKRLAKKEKKDKK